LHHHFERPEWRDDYVVAKHALSLVSKLESTECATPRHLSATLIGPITFRHDKITFGATRDHQVRCNQKDERGTYPSRGADAIASAHYW
jgi:hypothetical protein